MASSSPALHCRHVVVATMGLPVEAVEVEPEHELNLKLKQKARRSRATVFRSRIQASGSRGSRVNLRRGSATQCPWPSLARQKVLTP